MKKLKLYFRDTPIGSTDSSGTNTFIAKNNEERHYSLTWELLENSSVNKFIAAFNLHTKEGNINWNRYDTDNETFDINDLVNKLNDTTRLAMDLFDTKWFPEDYIITDLNDTDAINKKLNGIHFSFESLVLLPEILADKQRFDLCEELNFLVHQIEQAIHNREKEDPPHRARIFYVLRGEDHRYPFPKMTDEDYNRFTEQDSGDICLDFFTVGKDLHQAFITDDMELIRNKEVKPQTRVGAAFNFLICRETFKNYKQCMVLHNDNIRLRDEWCEQNNVSEYYDYKLPIHNVGRVKLGRLVEEDYDNIVKQLNKYRYICGAEIIDER